MKISMIMLVLTLLVSVFITGCLSSSTDPVSKADSNYCYFTLDDGSTRCVAVGDTECSQWVGGTSGDEKTIVASQETSSCY